MLRFVPVVLSCACDRAIDHSRWACAVDDERDSLMRAIESSGNLLGKSEEDVVSALGVPDAFEYEFVYAIDATNSACSQEGPAFIVRICQGRTVSGVGGSCVPDGEQIEFDADSWRNGLSARRLAMVRSLLYENVNPMLGIAECEVIRALGQPSLVSGPVLLYYGRAKDGSLRRVGRRLLILIPDGHVRSVRVDDPS